MKKAVVFTMLVFGPCGLFLGPWAQSAPVITQSLNKIPLAFTKNMGQWDEAVLFRANAGGAIMWFTKEGVTYQYNRRIDRSGALPAPDRHFRNSGSPSSLPFDRFSNLPDSIEQLVITAKFVGANPNVEVIGDEIVQYKCNYFNGHDPKKWHTDVPNFKAVILRDIYPGIDLKYAGDANGQATYEYVVTPTADMAQVSVSYEGAEGTSLDAEGRLILHTKWGEMIAPIFAPSNRALPSSGGLLLRPVTTIDFESDDAGRHALGTHAASLSHSTFLGGGGQDRGYGITVDNSGNAYVIGFSESTDYPTQNPYQTNLGDRDAFVTKVSNTGDSLIFSTYLGGGSGDGGSGIAVDANGNIYLQGQTLSSDFPTKNPFQPTNSGATDNFVAKLTPLGDSLIYSTYLGGGDHDQGNSLAIDAGGNAYVTGRTYSSDFPTLNPYQTNQGDIDAFVTKLSSSGGSLVYSTYLGGGNEEWGFGIAVDDSNNAYVTGRTSSSDFPTMNSYQMIFQGVYDGFVTKLSASGSGLYSTFLGGGNYDQGYAIAVDSFENTYITGFTQSSNFPVQNPIQGTSGGSEDAFVTKLSAGGDSLIYSTYIGGSAGDIAYGLALNNSDCAYVSGSTTSNDFPLQNPFLVSNAGLSDAFVTVVSADGNSLTYSTYLGGSADDGTFGGGLAVDNLGAAYVTGATASSDFPLANPFQMTFGGFEDAFVTKLRPNLCGDADGNSIITISDAVYLINYIFAGGQAPNPLLSGDADCNGIITISDAVYLINYIFSGGPAPCDACP